MGDGDAGAVRNERPTAAIDPALRAGVALFTEGFHLAAHEPWEVAWLPLESGPDERLLHGLIQFAAATHHARTGNASGAVGTAEGAIGYLSGLSDPFRGLALEPIRGWCRRIAVSPEAAATDEPPTLRVDGEAIGFDDLGPVATLAAIPAVAAATGIGDEGTMEAAVEFACEGIEGDEDGADDVVASGTDPLVDLSFAYLRQPDARPQIAARIADHVERRRRERDDVSGLF